MFCTNITRKFCAFNDVDEEEEDEEGEKKEEDTKEEHKLKWANLLE